MRTIKFRGKTVIDVEPLAIKKGDWVEGHYYEDLHQGEWCSWIQECNDITHYKVDKNTLGQFTGLTDKNGKEIYEGDILVWGENGYKGHPLLVMFKHGTFGYTYIGDCFHSFAGNTNFTFNPLNTDIRFEIIGNIHDNPELLKTL